MKRIAQVISWAALAATLVPPCLFFADKLPLNATQQWLLGAAILWFLTAPLWMERKAAE